MAYFEPTDLDFIIMEDQRIVIGDSPGATMTNANAQLFIDMSEAYINMSLAKKYTIPLTPAPSSDPTAIQTTEWNYIKSIVANRWAYELYSSVYAANIPNRSDYAEDHKERSEELLKKLLDNDILLSEQELTDSGISETEGQPISSVGERVLEETINMSGVGRDNDISLAYDTLKKYSEVVQDTARTTTYTRGTDYDIDYISGEIWRLTGGSITDATDHYITYYYYPDEPFGKRLIQRETDEYKRDNI